MYNNMSSINLDIDNDILEKAVVILNNIGLTLEDGINLFLEEVVREKKIPFEFDEFIYNKNKYPNEEILWMIKNIIKVKRGIIVEYSDDVVDD